jgi:hypothetical protein
VILTELEEELGVTESSLAFCSGVVLIRGSLRIRVRIAGWNVVLVQLLGGLDKGWGGIQTLRQILEQPQHGKPPGFCAEGLAKGFQSLPGCLLGRKTDPIIVRVV